ncbi:MAG: hypothetical protein AAGH88_00045 [Planctomycetota bacterium]
MTRDGHRHYTYDAQNRLLTTALAGFLASRGHCLLDLGRLKQAQHAYAHAVRLNPDDPNFRSFLAEARQRVQLAQQRARDEHQRYLEAIQKHHDAYVRQVYSENRRQMQRLMELQPPPPTPYSHVPIPQPPPPGY